MPDNPQNQQNDVPIFTRASDYKVLYSNFFRTRLGVGEVIMIFSQFTHSPSLDVTGNIIEEKAEVTMAWPQVKMFASQLSSLVKAIEEQIGPIPVPSGVVADQYEDAQMDAQRRTVQSLGLVTQAAPLSSPELDSPSELPEANSAPARSGRRVRIKRE